MKLLTINDISELNLKKKYYIRGYQKRGRNFNYNKKFCVYFNGIDLRCLKSVAELKLKSENKLNDDKNINKALNIDEIIRQHSTLFFIEREFYLCETKQEIQEYKNELILKKLSE